MSHIVSIRVKATKFESFVVFIFTVVITSHQLCTTMHGQSWSLFVFITPARLSRVLVTDWRLLCTRNLDGFYARNINLIGWFHDDFILWDTLGSRKLCNTSKITTFGYWFPVLKTFKTSVSLKHVLCWWMKITMAEMNHFRFPL